MPAASAGLLTLVRGPLARWATNVIAEPGRIDMEADERGEQALPMLYGYPDPSRLARVATARWSS